MNRRDFLAAQVKFSALAAGVGAGLFLPRAEVWAGEADLAVVKGKTGVAVRAAVEALGGMSRFVKPGQRVVIKPNMSFAAPVEAGCNTHPAAVAALVRMVDEAKAGEILVLDNPLAPAEACLEKSGIKAACDATGKGSVHQIESDRHFQEVKVAKGDALKKTEVMKKVLKADVLISAPTAKSHSSAGVSLSMKGLMGLILDRRSFHWKFDLDQAIVDLAGLLKPDLTVVDGTRVLSTGGPGGPGKVLDTKTIIASADFVAADAAAVEAFTWYGKKFKARQVRHIRLAAEQGLGRMDVGRMNVKRLEI